MLKSSLYLNYNKSVLVVIRLFSIYPIQNYSIAPGWILPVTKSPDLSIIELDRYVEFEPTVISPICLPSGNVQDIPSEKVCFQKINNRNEIL